MIYNNALYKISKSDNATEMFNSKTLIMDGLPSYNEVIFSTDDVYAILIDTTNKKRIIISFDDNGWYEEQELYDIQNNIMSIDSNCFFDVSDISLQKYYYNSTENIISSLTTKGDITYTIIEGKNIPKASEVLYGKKYLSKSGPNNGTMPNNGVLSYTPSTSAQTIPEGYTSGGTIAAVTSSIDNNIVAENIKSGTTILGVNGTYTGPGEGTPTSGTSLQSKYLLEGYNAVVDNTLITGTMKNYGTVTMNPTETEQEIPFGYYDELTVNAVDDSTLTGYDECLKELEVL